MRCGALVARLYVQTLHKVINRTAEVLPGLLPIKGDYIAGKITSEALQLVRRSAVWILYNAVTICPMTA